MFDERSIRLILVVAVLAGVLALGYALIALYRRSLQAPEPSGEGLLAELRAAYEAGEMDAEEYRRVRESAARLAGGGEAPQAGSARPIRPRAAPPIVGEGGPTPPVGGAGEA